MSHPSVSSSSNIPVAMLPRGWKVSSAILLGSARPVPCAKRCMQCSSWLYEAVKDSSAALAFEGAGLLSSLRLNAASVDLLVVVRTQAEWSNQHWRCAHIVYQFGKFRKFGFMLQISLPHIQLLSRSSARTSSCHQRYCKGVSNEAAKRMIRSNSAEDVHKTIPKNRQNDSRKSDNS